MKNYIYFKTTQCLYKHLLSKGAEFDFNKSVRCSRFTFYVDNRPQHHSTFHSMMAQFNSMLSEDDKIDVNKSKPKGRFGYLVFFEKDVVEESVPFISLEAVKTPEEHTSGEIEEVIEVVGEDVDWGWINSLENKKADKAQLDLYAEEEYNIKLNKAMTLKNMIADFKDKL